MPTSAPEWVRTMLVATVVPWRRLSTSARATPALAQRSRTPSTPPRAGASGGGGVVGGGRDFGDRDPARLLVEEDEVGEGAADVDADPLHTTFSRLRRQKLDQKKTWPRLQA